MEPNTLSGNVAAMLNISSPSIILAWLISSVVIVRSNRLSMFRNSTPPMATVIRPTTL